MESYFLAWWNVENLFDEEHAPPERRSAKVERVVKGELVGWTPELRDRKIAQLAGVIAGMNDARGPDLLGVCEIENRYVLDKLVSAVNGALATPRDYRVIHADTSDQRGIDVAFVYDAARLRVPHPDTDVFFHVVVRRTATRDIVQVTFETTAPQPRRFVVFGNHWPSRSGGQEESAGYRAIAGETLGYWHQRVLEVVGADTPVIAMGDFNDEAFDASLVRHALGCRNRATVTGARTVPKLWNLSWPVLGVPDGTFYFDGEPNVLDQFLVNKNLILAAAPMKADATSVRVVKPGAPSQHDKVTKPVPFGLGHKTNPDGWSDHFPVTMTVTAE